MTHLPNLLTFFRIMIVPIVAGCVLWGGYHAHLLGVVLFVLAAVSDFLDGYLARLWSLHTSFGRMLDPIADKLLIATTLLALTSTDVIGGPHVWAAMIILCREILVSGLREFLAELHVSMPVTRLAKMKTTVQFLAVGLLISGPIGGVFSALVADIGLFGLWLAALFTLITGADYWRHGVKYLK